MTRARRARRIASAKVRTRLTYTIASRAFCGVYCTLDRRAPNVRNTRVAPPPTFRARVRIAVHYSVFHWSMKRARTEYINTYNTSRYKRDFLSIGETFVERNYWISRVTAAYYVGYLSSIGIYLKN